MQLSTRTCFALAAATSVAGETSTRAEVTPVQKVLEMLSGMVAKGKEEKHAEQVQFASFTQFCDDTKVEKTRRIEEANEKIGMLTADIEKYTSDAELLTKEIAAHDEDVSVWQGDIKAATRVREIEHNDYTALHQDFSESIDALGRAIQVLKSQAHDRQQAASFSQLSTLTQLSLIPSDAKATINAFLEQGQQDLEGGLASDEQPAAAGYEFQSHGIIDMLEKLLDKFTSEHTDLEKSERNSQQAFEVLTQDLTAEIGQATADRERKAQTKAKKLEAKATAEGDVEDTTAIRNDDQKYLDDLAATCSQKTSAFNSRQALRADEIAALGKAIEIISSGDVAGNADKHLPTLVQTGKKGLALSALRADMNSGIVQEQVVRFLRERAQHLNSRVLSTLAARVAADPFVKVKKMIKDLIVRLMEEAGEEADHKAWCDTELATNEQVRKEKTDGVETLHAQIDELDASIAKLGDEIGDLMAAVADLDTAMAEATSIRQDEHKANEEAVNDAKASQTAVAQALTVLSEFYKTAGAATAFQQQKQQPAVPQVFNEAYQGMQAEGGGVIGMLEVIASDFARLEAETAAAEASAQKQYDTLMADSKADKSQKEKDIEHKTYKKQDESQARTVAKDDLQMMQDELNAALSYFDKLKPSCVDSGVSYDDRVARRKEEIESLQEALNILNGDDVAA